jgi:hypothetical protein
MDEQQKFLRDTRTSQFHSMALGGKIEHGDDDDDDELGFSTI